LCPKRIVSIAALSIPFVCSPNVFNLEYFVALNFYDFLNEIAIACLESTVVQLQALRDIVRAGACHDVSILFSKKESVPELGVAFVVVSHRGNSTKMNETHIQRSF